jgi:hypothetical protein
MNSEHSENSIRLLDIIYDLYGKDDGYPEGNLPFSMGEKGDIVLSDQLMLELRKEQNQDLIDWAQANIMTLFE